MKEQKDRPVASWVTGVIDDALIIVFVIIPWLMGIVLANGGWSITVAVLFPPYAWYLVVESAMAAIGWFGV